MPPMYLLGGAALVIAFLFAAPTTGDPVATQPTTGRRYGRDHELASGRRLTTYLVSSSRPQLVAETISEEELGNLEEVDARLGAWAAIAQQPFPTITSGHRTPELNAAIGGSSTSQHRTGRAADVIWRDPAGAVALWPVVQSGGELQPWDQLIMYVHKGHVHVHTARNPRGQLLLADLRDGRTVYERFNTYGDLVAAWAPRRRAYLAARSTT